MVFVVSVVCYVAGEGEVHARLPVTRAQRCILLALEARPRATATRPPGKARPCQHTAQCLPLVDEPAKDQAVIACGNVKKCYKYFGYGSLLRLMIANTQPEWLNLET